MKYRKAFIFDAFVKTDYTGAVAYSILLAREMDGTFHMKLFKSLCFRLSLVFSYVVRSEQR